MNWIVTELFFPDEVSTALIMTEIAQKKMLQGEVSVICGPIGYEKSYNTQKSSLDEKIKIHRVSIAELDKNKLISRVFRLLILTAKMGWLVMTKVKKQDSVLLVTNPAFLIIIVALIKKIKKFKLEILVHDIFPENLIPGGVLKNKNLKYRLLSKVYNFSYAKADKLIVLGEDMKALMSEKIKHNLSKIEVIPNWADESIVPIENFNISEYLSIDLKDKKVIGFAGNMGRLQGIMEFVELFVKASNPNLVLVFIGDGALKNELETYIEDNSIDNIILAGSRPRSEQLLFLNACDIALICLKKGMKGLGVPSKAYNIMAAGKPIFYIGDENSEIDTYIKKFNCGWSFQWEDQNTAIEFINTLSEIKYDELKRKGMNSRSAVEQYFSKEIILNKFLNP